MTSIRSYQKVSLPHVVVTMLLPDSQGADLADSVHCTELCTIDGTTYVAVPDGVTLPTQPEQITVSTVTLTDALKEQIKAASPHVALISERMIQKIRAKYSIDDEMFFARIGVGAALGLYTPTAGEQASMQEFGAFVEAARQWGRDERAKLGL